MKVIGDHGHRGPRLRAQARDARLGVGRRQPHPHQRVRGGQVLEHDPLVALQVLHRLIRGRRAEVAPVEIVGQDGDGRGQRPGIERAEEPRARRPRRRDRPEPHGALGIGGVDDARVRGPDRVVVRLGPAGRVLVPERHAVFPLEITARNDVERFVDQREIAVDGEAHRRALLRHRRMAGEHDVGARAEGREIARGPHALRRAPGVVDLGRVDLVGRTSGHDPVGHEGERGFDDHGDPESAAVTPRQRRGRGGADRVYFDRPSSQHWEGRYQGAPAVSST